MSYFALNISGTPTINTIAKRALYRRRSIGGAFSGVGFSPTNDLPANATQTSISGLLYNVAYQFRVDEICENGVVNGNIKDAIKFNCLPYDLVINDDNFDFILNINTSNVDINKIKAVIPSLPDVEINVINGVNTLTFDGLVEDTEYQVQIFYGAILNGVQYWDLAPTCTFSVTTNSACPAPTNLVVATSSTCPAPTNLVVAKSYNFILKTDTYGDYDIILSLSPSYSLSAQIPLANNSIIYGYQNGGTDIEFEVQLPLCCGDRDLILKKNGVTQQTLFDNGSENYTFDPISFLPSDIIQIEILTT